VLITDVVSRALEMNVDPAAAVEAIGFREGGLSAIGKGRRRSGHVGCGAGGDGTVEQDAGKSADHQRDDRDAGSRGRGESTVHEDTAGRDGISKETKGIAR
jgi:hypothetical protein